MNEKNNNKLSPTTGQELRMTKKGINQTNHVQMENKEKEKEKEKDPSVLERLVIKIQALIWVGIGIFIFFHTNLLPVLLSDPRIHRVYLNLSLVCFTINLVCVVYIIVVLPYLQGVTIP